MDLHQLLSFLKFAATKTIALLADVMRQGLSIAPEQSEMGILVKFAETEGIVAIMLTIRAGSIEVISLMPVERMELPCPLTLVWPINVQTADIKLRRHRRVLWS